MAADVDTGCPTDGTKPWFSGCEYTCQFSKCAAGTFHSEEAFKIHVRENHRLSVKDYEWAFGSLETKTEWIRCKECRKTVKRNHGSLRAHLKRHKLTLQKYAEKHGIIRRGDCEHVQSEATSFGAPDDCQTVYFEEFVNACRFDCRLCVVDNSFSSLKDLHDHVVDSHSLTPNEYLQAVSQTSDRKAEFITKLVRHNCLICQSPVRQSRYTLTNHITLNHGIELEEYYACYVANGRGLGDLFKITDDARHQPRLSLDVKDGFDSWKASQFQCIFKCKECDGVWHTRAEFGVHLRKSHPDKASGLLLDFTPKKTKCRVCHNPVLKDFLRIADHVRSCHRVSPAVYYTQYVHGKGEDEDMSTEFEDGEDLEAKVWADSASFKCQLCKNFNQQEMMMGPNQELVQFQYQPLQFRAHLNECHGMSLSDYKKEHPPTAAGSPVLIHTCRLCGKKLRHLQSVFVNHLACRHSMSLTAYYMKYIKNADFQEEHFQPPSMPQKRRKNPSNKSTPKGQVSLGTKLGPRGPKSLPEVRDWVNQVKFECEECHNFHTFTYTIFLKHITMQHGLNNQQYKLRYPEFEKSQKTHSCLICGTSLKHYYHSIYAHLKAHHQMTIQEYYMKYVKDVDPKVAKQYSNTAKMSPSPRQSLDNGKGPHVTWANGMTFACEICKVFSTKVYSAFNRHLLQHDLDDGQRQKVFLNLEKIFRVHKCFVCGEEIKHYFGAVSNHVKNAHQMTLKGYFSKYIDPFAGGSTTDRQPTRKGKTSQDQRVDPAVREWAQQTVFHCLLCTSFLGRSYLGFISHLKTFHQVSLAEYSSKFPEFEKSMKFHRCKICLRMVKHHMQGLYHHMKSRHNMTVAEYYNRHVNGEALAQARTETSIEATKWSQGTTFSCLVCEEFSTVHESEFILHLHHEHGGLSLPEYVLIHPDHDRNIPRHICRICYFVVKHYSGALHDHFRKQHKMTIAEYYSKYISQEMTSPQPAGPESFSRNQNANGGDLLESIVREHITGQEIANYQEEEAFSLQEPSSDQPLQLYTSCHESPVNRALPVQEIQVEPGTPVYDDIHHAKVDSGRPLSTFVEEGRHFQVDDVSQPSQIRATPPPPPTLDESGYGSSRKIMTSGNAGSRVTPQQPSNMGEDVFCKSTPSEMQNRDSKCESEEIESSPVHREQSGEVPTTPPKKLRSVNDWISNVLGDKCHTCLLCKESIRQSSLWVHMFKVHKMSLDFYFAKHVRESLKVPKNVKKKPKMKSPRKQPVDGSPQTSSPLDFKLVAEATEWTGKNTYFCQRCDRLKGTKFLSKLKQHYRIHHAEIDIMADLEDAGIDAFHNCLACSSKVSHLARKIHHDPHHIRKHLRIKHGMTILQYYSKHRVILSKYICKKAKSVEAERRISRSPIHPAVSDQDMVWDDILDKIDEQLAEEDVVAENSPPTKLAEDATAETPAHHANTDEGPASAKDAVAETPSVELSEDAVAETPSIELSDDVIAETPSAVEMANEDVIARVSAVDAKVTAKEPEKKCLTEDPGTSKVASVKEIEDWANKVTFKCLECNAFETKSYRDFCNHIRTRHKMLKRAYSKKFPDSEDSFERHTCLLCGLRLKHHSTAIYEHLHKKHGSTTTESYYYQLVKPSLVHVDDSWMDMCKYRCKQCVGKTFVSKIEFSGHVTSVHGFSSIKAYSRQFGNPCYEMKLAVCIPCDAVMVCEKETITGHIKKCHERHPACDTRSLFELST